MHGRTGRIVRARTRLFAVVAAVVMTISAAVPASAAGAQDSPRSLLDFALLTDPERTDFAAIAAHEGWSLTEAVRRIGWQDWFAGLAADLSATFPDAFAGAAITGKGEGGWISFAGPVPDGLAKVVSNLPVPVRLVGGKGFTERELSTAMYEAYLSLLRQPGIADAVGSYDIETGAVTIDVAPESPGVRASGLRFARPANSAIKFELNVVRNIESANDANVNGGGAMFRTNGTRQCTGSFTVVGKKTGRKGFASAAHCAMQTYLRYYNHKARSYTTVKLYGKKTGTSGDIAWNSSGTYGVSDEFYYSYGKLRRVRGTGQPIVGQSICNYGMRTGYKCTTVYRNNVCRAKGTYCGLTAAGREVTDYGDSGGVWFLNSTAYGVHSARTTIDGRVRSLFTPVAKLDDLGVRVITARCGVSISGVCMD